MDLMKSKLQFCGSPFMMLSENFTWKEMQELIHQQWHPSVLKPFKDDYFLVYILGELQHIEESYWFINVYLAFCLCSARFR